MCVCVLSPTPVQFLPLDNSVPCLIGRYDISTAEVRLNSYLSRTYLVWDGIIMGKELDSGVLCTLMKVRAKVSGNIRPVNESKTTSSPVSVL